MSKLFEEKTPQRAACSLQSKVDLWITSSADLAKVQIEEIFGRPKIRRRNRVRQDVQGDFVKLLGMIWRISSDGIVKARRGPAGALEHPLWDDSRLGGFHAEVGLNEFEEKKRGSWGDAASRMRPSLNTRQRFGNLN
jgi:hypothetical protein